VLDVLSCRRDPSTVELIRKEADEALADYDAWAISKAEFTI
jgi:hypothetical protein